MLNKILKDERIKHKLTQEKVAKIIGISQPTYLHYETGQRRPKYDKLKKFADLYNVTTDYLLGHSPEPDHNLDIELGGFLTKNGEINFQLNERNLIHFRKNSTISLEKIAKELNIDIDSYLKYEEIHSINNVNKETVEKLSLLFNVHLTELVYSQDERIKYTDDEETIENDINNKNYIVINNSKIEITDEEAEYINESLNLYRKLKNKK